MAHKIITDVIETRREDLNLRGQSLLKQITQELEARVAQVLGNEDTYKKLLWLQLVSFGYRLRNDQLCLVIVERLDLNDLVLSLKAPDINGSVVLERVAQYFQLKGFDGKQRTGGVAKSEAKLVPLDIGGGSAVIGHKAVSDAAEEQELDENFEVALSCYESIGLHYEHMIRLTMKHLMCSANHVLRECCENTFLLQNIWFEYLVACGSFDEAANFDQSELRGNSNRDVQQRKSISVWPNHITDFVAAGPTKWANKKKLNLVSSVGRALDVDRRMLMADLAINHLKRLELGSALALAQCLNEPDLIIEQYLEGTNHPLCLMELSRICARMHATTLVSRLTREFARIHGAGSYELIKSAISALGLLDEILNLSTTDLTSTEDCMSQLGVQMESVSDSSFGDKLSNFDPTIDRGTLKNLLRILKSENNKDLNISTIIVILFAIKIFIMKLKPNSISPSSMTNLEGIFEGLSMYLDELTFSASDSLVHATNSLVIIIKEKLDVLADNESIRESFKKLVDAVAGRCLIEARYKGAAILYSQIGDNANAIKSLMRTGEVQTVVDYALLVRDITVNRIAINFMKHLKVDPDLIQSFIAQTKS